jgi:hypothetical protein
MRPRCGRHSLVVNLCWRTGSGNSVGRAVMDRAARATRIVSRDGAGQGDEEVRSSPALAR